LEVSVEALIEGTDAEGRLEDATSTVRRSDYEAVVAKLIEFEAENGDLRRRLESTKEASVRCEEALRKAERRATEASGEASRARGAKRELEEQLAYKDAELKRYHQALAKAVAEFDGLRAQVAALQKELGDAKASSKVAAVLAGIGAVAGVATLSRFMERDEDEGPEPDSSRTRRKRR
jgi:chromosome segregation ATPase